jgi:hypothetical protein
MVFYPEIFTVLAAELTFITVRSEDILIVTKLSRQRTALEQTRIERGLRRSLVFELLLFVPVSAGLLIILSPIILPMQLTSLQETRSAAVHAALGVLSYGFPFATIRQIMTRIALNTLKEFSSIATGHVSQDAAPERDGERL